MNFSIPWLVCHRVAGLFLSIQERLCGSPVLAKRWIREDSVTKFLVCRKENYVAFGTVHVPRYLVGTHDPMQHFIRELLKLRMPILILDFSNNEQAVSLSISFTFFFKVSGDRAWNFP